MQRSSLAGTADKSFQAICSYQLRSKLNDDSLCYPSQDYMRQARALCLTPPRSDQPPLSSFFIPTHSPQQCPQPRSPPPTTCSSESAQAAHSDPTLRPSPAPRIRAPARYVHLSRRRVPLLELSRFSMLLNVGFAVDCLVARVVARDLGTVRMIPGESRLGRLGERGVSGQRLWQVFSKFEHGVVRFESAAYS